MENNKEFKIIEDFELENILEESQMTYDLKNRTKLFSYKCFELCEMLPNTYFGKHLKGQLFRCSSSVAANYRATCCAQSKAAFVSKISIVIEEVDESAYWLDFIYENKILNNDLLIFLRKEAKELTAIFNSSRKTAKANINKTSNN